MSAWSVWRSVVLLWMFCVNGLGYNDEDYLSYNEITDAEAESATAERLRWEKLFIMVEDSVMMQKMLLQADQQLKVELSSLKHQISTISTEISRSCLRVLEETCRSMNTPRNGSKSNSSRQRRDVQQRATEHHLEKMEQVQKKESWSAGGKRVALTEFWWTEKLTDG